jgi:DNA-binding beta-propeller fold protein YncE
VTARGSDDLLAFNAADLISDPGHSLVARVPVGTAPVGLAFVKNGTEIVVADSNRFHAAGGAANLAVVDVHDALARRQALVETVPSGAFPRQMVLDGTTLLVTNYDSQQVEAVDVARLP